MSLAVIIARNIMVSVMRMNFIHRAVSKLKGSIREAQGAQIVSNGGVRLHIDRGLLSDETIVRALLFDRHERTEAALVKYALRAGDKVLELGSGVGYITMLCARICGDRNVVTVEGNPRMHQLLIKNLQLNGLDVDARQSVVSLQGGPVSFNVADSLVSSSLHHRAASEAHTVPSTPFVQLLEEVRPSVVIMDIEGSEVDLLGVVDMPTVRAIGVETHPQIVGEHAVSQMSERLGAMGFVIDGQFPIQSRRVLYTRSLQS